MFIFAKCLYLPHHVFSQFLHNTHFTQPPLDSQLAGQTVGFNYPAEHSAFFILSGFKINKYKFSI